MSAAGDSTVEANKGSSTQQQTQASDNEASGSGSASLQDVLEDQLRTLHQQINNSDWLQNNTAEMWMEANPEAAAQLKQIFAEKDASRNAPSPANAPAQAPAQKQQVESNSEATTPASLSEGDSSKKS